MPIHVQQAELDIALREGHTIVEWVDFPDARYEAVEGDREVVEGVSVLATPGHTPGHQSVTVRTGDGLVLIVGQAAQDARSFATGPADASIQQLRELERGPHPLLARSGGAAPPQIVDGVNYPLSRGSTPSARVAAVREFNRFYTGRIGVLDESSSRAASRSPRYASSTSWRTESSATASELGRDLGIDAGYLVAHPRSFARRGDHRADRGEGRRASVDPPPHGARQGYGRAARGEGARADRCDAGRRPAGGAGARRRIDAGDRARPAAGDARCAEGRAAPAPARRHGLGRRAARRALLAGVRVG